MSIPDTIKKHKPEGLNHAADIRFIGGHYYVYEITSVWDGKKGRPQKKTVGCIGKITENDGFIPNKRYIDNYHYSKLELTIKNYGAIEMFRILGSDIRENLKNCFPDIYRQIEIVALLRLVYRSQGKDLKYDYEHSYLSDIYPDIGTCRDSINSVMLSIAKREYDRETFMKRFIISGHTLVFDGTSIFSSCSDSIVEKGYNSSKSQRKQYRLMYVFDRELKTPIFYRVIPGSIVDKSAFINTVRQINTGNCIVIGDKGFYSKTNSSALMSAGLRFILPLQNNTTMIPRDFDIDDSDRKFDGRFTYKSRNIWHKKLSCGDMGNCIYIFKDDFRKAEANAKFTERQEKNYGEKPLTDEDFFADTRRGIFSFISNIDTSAKEIYMVYKERWEIENCFDYLKNSVVGKPGYNRSNDEIEADSFINHIALLYFYKLIRKLDVSGLKKDYTPEDIIKRGRNVFKRSEYIGHKVITEMTKEDEEIFKALGVTL